MSASTTERCNTCSCMLGRFNFGMGCQGPRRRWSPNCTVARRAQHGTPRAHRNRWSFMGGRSPRWPLKPAHGPQGCRQTGYQPHRESDAGMGERSLPEMVTALVTSVRSARNLETSAAICGQRARPGNLGAMLPARGRLATWSPGLHWILALTAPPRIGRGGWASDVV